MGVAAMVAAMSVGIAAPARAQCPSGVPGAPQLNTIYRENGQVRINPSALGSDAGAVEAYAAARVADAIECAFGLVPAQAWCVASKVIEIASIPNPEKPRLRYVYLDSSGEIVVDYGLLLEDARGCV
jgi:hypothetical protein